jgi:hypothetical protein
MPAERIMLILRRSPEQQAALESYLQSVQQPDSPEYRKYLTPEQFGSRYGISDTDLRTVQAWLLSQGFQGNKVNKGRTAIEFSGTVGQLQQAFHAPIHSYRIDGAPHWANASDPMIPAALAPVVAGVATLNDFKPRPHSILGPAATWNAGQHRFVPDLNVLQGTTPYLFVAPGDAATIYDAPNSLNTHLASNQTPYDGTGVTIGLVENTLVSSTAVDNYRALFGLPANHIAIVYDGNQNNFDGNADQTEALLDSEVSGGLAPGANVRVYTAADTVFQAGVLLAIYRAIDDNDAGILSVSFGGCEAAQGAAGNLQILNAWEQAAAQGMAVTVSAGDSGSAGCDNPRTETVATQGLAVNGLGSTPYNIAVGGTDFDALPDSFNTYVSSANGANYTSALSYIPENPWNNSPAQNGLLAANSAYTSGGKTNIVAGGGGASSLGSVDGSGNQSGYPKPAWQKQFAASNTDSVRDLPDVSLLAANARYRATWAVCASGDCEGSSPTIHGVGGTSASAPAFAGILALVNQRIGATARLGQANWVLYKLAQTTPGAFHQITSGNNSVYCTPTTPNCGSNSFLSGYDAGSGYNMATGLGSVDIANLVNNWSSAALAQTSTTLKLDTTSFTHGTAVNITAGVNPAAATGDVAIVNNAKSQNGATRGGPPVRLLLSGGSATGNSTQFPGGTYNVYANYGGDGAYAGSVSQPVQVAVAPEDSVVLFSVYQANSNGQLSPVSGGATLPLGTAIVMNAQPIGKSQAGSPNPITDATGTVEFSYPFNGGVENGGNETLDSTGDAQLTILTLNAGAHPLTADYSGDLSYNPSSATFNLAVAQAATSISVAPSVASIANGSLNINAAVSANLPANLYSYQGSVTYTDVTNNTVLGTTAAAISGACTGVTTMCSSIPLTVYVNQLAMGANSITATYSGDTNFIGSGPSAPTTVTCTAGCSNGSGQTLQLSFGQESAGTISPGGTITAVVSVNPGGGFTGAVNMTCSVAGKNAGDIHIPTCSFSPTQVSVASSTLAASTTLTINTTAATTSALQHPKFAPWYAASGTGLVFALLLVLPARRQTRNALLGLLVLIMAVAWVSACGGGGSTGGSGGSGGGGGNTIPGTSADIYTVTFHAADAATGTVTAQDWFNFTVN